MTAQASHAVVVDSRLFGDIVDILSNVTGVVELAEPGGIAPDTRLESDLRMESIELVAFSDELRRCYGDQVDLPGYLATLELDQLVGLTVADVTGYVAANRLHQQDPPSRQDRPSRQDPPGRQDRSVPASLDQHGTNAAGGTPR